MHFLFHANECANDSRFDWLALLSVSKTPHSFQINDMEMVMVMQYIPKFILLFRQL